MNKIHVSGHAEARKLCPPSEDPAYRWAQIVRVHGSTLTHVFGNAYGPTVAKARRRGVPKDQARLLGRDAALIAQRQYLHGLGLSEKEAADFLARKRGTRLPDIPKEVSRHANTIYNAYYDHHFDASIASGSRVEDAKQIAKTEAKQIREAFVSTVTNAGFDTSVICDERERLLSAIRKRTAATRAVSSVPAPKVRQAAGNRDTSTKKRQSGSPANGKLRHANYPKPVPTASKAPATNPERKNAAMKAGKPATSLTTQSSASNPLIKVIARGTADTSEGNRQKAQAVIDLARKLAYDKAYASAKAARQPAPQAKASAAEAGQKAAKRMATRLGICKNDPQAIEFYREQLLNPDGIR